MTRKKQESALEIKGKKTVKRVQESTEQSQNLPPISIGLIGHVDHGKTTLVQTLSGKWTDTHSEELKRGITIRLGYADITIFECPKCPSPQRYGTKETCALCGSQARFYRLVSLVDAPGHESLMATMLSGASVFDGALLLIAANEKCPQPQTIEHVMALEILDVKNLIVIQNKIDAVSVEQAKKNHEEIKAFLADTPFKDAPVLPVSARYNLNIDVLFDTIVKNFQVPEKKIDAPPEMLVVRSFDVNKPGTLPSALQGGVLGGVLRTGTLHVGDTVEILPGYEVEEKNQKVWKPLQTSVAALMIGGKSVDSVTPGGTFAVQTKLDPSVVKSDKLTGSLLGHSGSLPKTRNTLTLEVHLLKRQVDEGDKLLIEPLKIGEWLMLNVNAAATVGRIKEMSKSKAVLELKRPVCANAGARMTISRRTGQRWRLIGYGLIL